MEENDLIKILKDVIARIKNELLLFSIVAIILIILFNDFRSQILIIYILGCLFFILTKFLNKKENNNYLLNFNKFLSDGHGWRKEFIDNKEVWFYNENNFYQIEVGESVRDFSESWTKVYPDKEGSWVKYVYLKAGNLSIKQFLFVSCDGGRILVPSPNREIVGGKINYWFDKNSLEYKIGKIIGDFYIYDNIEGVAKMSNIEIK